MIYFKLPFGKHMIHKFPELELDVKVDNQFLVEDDKFFQAYSIAVSTVMHSSWNEDTVVINTGNLMYPKIIGTYLEIDAIINEMLKY
jgi:hypothetical protein